MSLFQLRASMAALLFAGAGLLGIHSSTHGQAKDEAEEGRFRTADGLRLNYLWYAGGKGQKSDCVMLIPKYGYDSTKADTKAQWTSLAKALQKEGYSVLMFDFRGHGKSADFRTMDKPDVFCKPDNSYNSLSGQNLNPRTIKQLDKARFSPRYYPFLVNDITAARRFLDDQNDAGQCNSGRVFVIAEQDICPLVMLWSSTEFARYAFGPKTRQDDPEKINAGEDLCGVIFLSWQGTLGMGTTTAINVANKVLADKELGSESITIYNQIKKKVAMAFIYGKEDKASAQEARLWFSRFGIPPSKNQDAETVKYIREIPGAEKLSGIKLLDIPDKATGASLLESQIIEFMKATKSKAIAGNNWKERKMENLDAVAVPLDIWGLKWMK